MTKQELKVGDRARIARWGAGSFIHDFDEFSGTEGYINDISPNGATVLKTEKGLRYGDISGLDPIPDGPEPEPRITFTVGGQEFYVGQRVWSTKDYGIAPLNGELEILGAYNNFAVTRTIKTSMIALMDQSSLSTSPPAPHVWEFGDVASHKEHGVGIVTSWASSQYAIEITTRASNQIWVHPFELTFIRRADLSV